MPHSSLPAFGDVITLLGSLPEPIVLPDGFDVESELAAAITSWNERTHYRPFFQASSSPTSRPFDPPGPDRKGYNRGGSLVLLLRNGLLSLTSLYVGVNAATGATGTLLTQGLDFWLTPANAIADGQPYTEVEFAFVRRGLPQSIVISGVWGYCTGTIPDDAWAAIRDIAAARCLETLAVYVTQGPTTSKVLHVETQFDSRVIQDILAFLQKRGERVLARYRLMH